MRLTARALAIFGLYGLTMLGVWHHYARVEARRAEREYREAERLQAEMDARCAVEYQRVICDRRIVSGSGPASFAYALPLLPGVALVASGFAVGPLWAAGSLKLVLWYGADPLEYPFASWVS